MPTPRRNEPCPCGSGRKYKHCHGAPNRGTTTSHPAAWRTLRRVLEGYPTMMLRFVDDVYGAGAIDEAWHEFTLWEGDEARFDAESPHLQVFMPWFFHRWAPDPLETSIEEVSLHHRSPTSVLLERRPRRLDPVLRRYLGACLETPFTFHEILRSDPDVGFLARDVFTGRECEVLERSASRTMRTGDLLFGQLVTSDGVTLLEACSPFPIPPREKLGLVDLRERMAGGSLPLSPETLGEWDIELRQAYLDIVRHIVDPPLPRMQNTDGEELVFHRLRFEISSPRKAFEALRHLALDETEAELLESAEHDPEGELRSVSIAWKAAGNRLHRSWDNTVLGDIDIDGERLVASVNSRERAVRLKEIIEESLGEDVRHRETEVETFEDAMDRARAGPEAPDEALAPHAPDSPEIRQRIGELMAAHYEDWVSERIPALGGLTPLEAVRDAAGREKVEALVTQMERDATRMEPAVDPAVLRRMRERLGLA